MPKESAFKKTTSNIEESIMKNNTLFIVAFGIFILGFNTSYAEEKALSKQEIRVLFEDKTFDGTNIIKNKKFRIFSSSDGKLKIKYSNGKTKSRYWRVTDEGKHCISKREGKGGQCSVIKTVGSGIFHTITNDEHTRILKNFVEGNQL